MPASGFWFQIGQTIHPAAWVKASCSGLRVASASVNHGNVGLTPAHSR